MPTRPRNIRTPTPGPTWLRRGEEDGNDWAAAGDWWSAADGPDPASPARGDDTRDTSIAARAASLLAQAADGSRYARPLAPPGPRREVPTPTPRSGGDRRDPLPRTLPRSVPPQERLRPSEAARSIPPPKPPPSRGRASVAPDAERGKAAHGLDVPTQLFEPRGDASEAVADAVLPHEPTPLHLQRLGPIGGAGPRPPQADPYARRAERAPSEPRPQEATEWPPPPLRPLAPTTGSWEPEETAFVVDPAVARSRPGGIQVDRTTWILGITALGVTGVVTGGSVLLVLFVLSLG